MIGVVALLLSTAQAGEPSSLGIGVASRTGVVGTWTTGTRPDSARIPGPYTQPALAATWRASTLPWTSAHGSQVGLEWGLGVGVVAHESGVPSASASPINFGVTLASTVGPAARVATWNTPLRGGLVVHWEAGLHSGGRSWWSDGMRASASGGARVLHQLSDHVTLELDATLVPFVATKNPVAPVRVRQQRGELSLGLGSVGVAVQAVHAAQYLLTEHRGAEVLESGGAWTFGIAFEQRRSERSALKGVGG